MIKQLDQVIILTTERVQWLSAPSGAVASPQGVWTVLGVLDTNILVAKDSTILSVPYGDLKIVGRYNNDQVIQKIQDLRVYGKKERQAVRTKLRFVNSGSADGVGGA